jgi:hypothetical protein
VSMRCEPMKPAPPVTRMRMRYLSDEPPGADGRK